MKLPHLDQVVLLEWGEAGLLGKALAVLVCDVTHAQRPVPLVEVLTFAPLAALAKRLYQRHQGEQRTPVKPGRPFKPWRLRVRGEQLAALLFCQGALYYCDLSEEERLLLRGVVGKFQQRALHLSAYIRFT